MAGRVDDHGAMLRVRSPIRRGRWLLSSPALLLLAVGAPSTLKPSGTHGHLPDLPELRASFFLIGPGVPAGRSLGIIDMRDVAPTLARRLGLTLPTADGKTLLP